MSSHPDLLDYRRYRVINKLTVFIAMVNLFHGLVWYLVGANGVSMIATITCLLMLMTLFIKRRIDTVQLKANLNIGILFLSLTMSSLMTYESSNLVIFWLFILPLGTLLFVEKGWFFFWIGALMVSVLLIPITAKYMPFAFRFEPQYVSLVKYVQIVGLLLSSFILALLYRNLIFGTIRILNNKKVKLTKKSRDLRETQKYKDQFFANMGHELRTPMNAIMGIAELLDLEDEKDNELVNYLRNSSDHLLAIINDLMDFSKMQEKKLELNYQEFDLPSIVQASFNLVKIMAVGKKLSFNLFIDDNIPQYVMGDPRRLNQVLINILTNAIKYTPESGHIYYRCYLDRYSTHEESDVVRVNFEISDTGIGISKPDLQNIFKDYFRSEAARRKNISGTGLGLFITKYLVDAMGGDIQIESEQDLGTTVTISIDFRVSDSCEIRDPETGNDVLVFDKPLSILLVDDNNLNLLIAEKQLQRIVPPGSFIYTAVNGQEAVNIYKEFYLDIILMDMEMPVMDGVTATSAIRHIESDSEKNTPIIIITANLGIRDTRPCIDSGADAVIGKPFLLHNVSQTMQKLLTEDHKSP